MSLTKYKIGPELRRALHKSGHWKHWSSVKLDHEELVAEAHRQEQHVPEFTHDKFRRPMCLLDLAAYHLICQQRKRPWFQHAIEYFLHHPNPRLEALKIAWAILVLLLLALCARPAHAQGGSDTAWQFKLSAAGRSASFDNRTRGCTTLHMVYFNSGFATLSLELDWAADSSGAAGAWNTWTDLPTGSTLPLTDTIGTQISAFKYKPWVSVNLNSATGSGFVAGYVLCRTASANNNASFSGDQISSNQGTANTLANAWPVKVTDGVTAVSLTGSSLNVNCTAGCGGGGTVDVSDRAARLLGHVTVDSAPTTAVTVASLPLPANAAQETGGNLAAIAANTSTNATAVRQDTGNASLASIDSKMPAQVNSSQPVTIVNPQAIMPPPISAATAANPLLFRAAMQQFCRTNLCTGVK